MAKQDLNIGTIANDGTGDNLRSAMTKVEANFTEIYSDRAENIDDVEFLLPDEIYAMEGAKLPFIPDRMVMQNTFINNTEINVWNPVTNDGGAFYGNRGTIEQKLNGSTIIDMDVFGKLLEFTIRLKTASISRSYYKRCVVKNASLAAAEAISGNVCIIGDSVTTGDFFALLQDRVLSLNDGSVTYNGSNMLGGMSYASYLGLAINLSSIHPNYNVGDGSSNTTAGKYLYPATAQDLIDYPDYCFTGEVYGTPYVPYALNRRYSGMSAGDRSAYEALTPTVEKPYQGKYYIFNIGQYFDDNGWYDDISGDIIKGMFIIQLGQNDFAPSLNNLSASEVSLLQNFMVRKIDADFGNGVVRIGVVPSYSDNNLDNWSAFHSSFIKLSKKNCSSYTKVTSGYIDSLSLSGGWQFDGINAHIIPTWIHHPVLSAFRKAAVITYPITIGVDGNDELLDYALTTGNSVNYNLHSADDSYGFLVNPIVYFIVNELV
jgi:hypothetical protein